MAFLIKIREISYMILFQDYFLKKFKKDLKDNFSDLSNQGLFNIFSLKIF